MTVVRGFAKALSVPVRVDKHPPGAAVVRARCLIMFDAKLPWWRAPSEPTAISFEKPCSLTLIVLKKRNRFLEGQYSKVGAELGLLWRGRNEK